MGRPIPAERKIQRLGANGREYVQNTMRFPPDLYELIRDSAVAAGRTMNAEVVLRLQMAYGQTTRAEVCPARGDVPATSLADDVAAIRQLLEQMATRGAT